MVLYLCLENSQGNCLENRQADWLKIVFLALDGDTELARAVDVMIAGANRIYSLIIKGAWKFQV